MNLPDITLAQLVVLWTLEGQGASTYPAVREALHFGPADGGGLYKALMQLETKRRVVRERIAPADLDDEARHTRWRWHITDTGREALDLASRWLGGDQCLTDST